MGATTAAERALARVTAGTMARVALTARVEAMGATGALIVAGMVVTEVAMAGMEGVTGVATMAEVMVDTVAVGLLVVAALLLAGACLLGLVELVARRRSR